MREVNKRDTMSLGISDSSEKTIDFTRREVVATDGETTRGVRYCERFSCGV